MIQLRYIHTVAGTAIPSIREYCVWHIHAIHTLIIIIRTACIAIHNIIDVIIKSRNKARREFARKLTSIPPPALEPGSLG